MNDMYYYATKGLFTNVNYHVQCLVRDGSLPLSSVGEYESNGEFLLAPAFSPYVVDSFYTKVYDGSGPRLKDNTLFLLNLANFCDAITVIKGLCSKSADPTLMRELTKERDMASLLFLHHLRDTTPEEKLEYMKYQMRSQVLDVLNSYVKEAYDDDMEKQANGTYVPPESGRAYSDKFRIFRDVWTPIDEKDQYPNR